MLTAEQVQQQSSTRAVREMTAERLQYLIGEAKLRIELFTARPFVEGDNRLEMIHFRLVEAMALTDTDEVLGAEARGLVAESDQGYSWSIQREATTTGYPLIDSLLRQWLTFAAQQTSTSTTESQAV